MRQSATEETSQMKSKMNRSLRSSSKDATGRGIGRAPRPAITKKVQPEPVQVTINPGNKELRAKQDRGKKWNPQEIRHDYVEKLRDQARQCLGADMEKKMFSSDFKLHCECIDIFTNFISQSPQELMMILDIVFKWIFVKIFDSNNTKLAVNIFDFLAILFPILEQGDYLLWDNEIDVVFPMLTEKAGLNNNILKEKVKKLIRMTYSICDKQ